MENEILMYDTILYNLSQATSLLLIEVILFGSKDHFFFKFILKGALAFYASVRALVSACTSVLQDEV